MAHLEQSVRTLDIVAVEQLVDFRTRCQTVGFEAAFKGPRACAELAVAAETQARVPAQREEEDVDFATQPQPAA